jgi:hypothetical protein
MDTPVSLVKGSHRRPETPHDRYRPDVLDLAFRAQVPPPVVYRCLRAIGS